MVLELSGYCLGLGPLMTKRVSGCVQPVNVELGRNFGCRVLIVS